MTSGEAARPIRSWIRIDGVDLLRGLAILLVLMNHVNMRLLFAKVPYTRGLPHQLVSSLVWNGQRGVQMFFAISGFLITSTALRRWGSLKAVNVGDFYRLRFARIGPLLLALLTVLSVLHLAHVENFVVSSKTGGLGQALIAALTFHVNVLEARRGYLPGSWDILWSLSVEEVFYLLFPLVCRLGGKAEVADGNSGRIRSAGAVRTSGVPSRQRGLAGVFLPGRDGCDRSGMHHGDGALAMAALAEGGVALLEALGLSLLIFSLGFSLASRKSGP
jgi:peptidoglycan/LPS O-acetylase OafA/YrhL